MAKPEKGVFVPEDYRSPTKRGNADYSKSTEGFVPIDQISSEHMRTEAEKEVEEEENYESNMDKLVTEADEETIKEIAEGDAEVEKERKKRRLQEIEAGWSPNKENPPIAEIAEFSETVGREKKRYGANYPQFLSPEKRRGLEEGGVSKKTITTGYRRKRSEIGARADKGAKPIYKTERRKAA